MNCHASMSINVVVFKVVCVGRVLQNGGTCVDAVVNAVKTMEDNPAFNAGKLVCSRLTAFITSPELHKLG